MVILIGEEMFGEKSDKKMNSTQIIHIYSVIYTQGCQSWDRGIDWLIIQTMTNLLVNIFHNFLLDKLRN